MKLKKIISDVFYGILQSYEGKKFWPSLITKLVMALVSAVITAFFANTLFSVNSTVNQIFSALFFYFIILSVSKLINEIKQKGVKEKLKPTFLNMVKLAPPSLWFFLGALVVALFLPYPFVLSLALLLFCSALSQKNSLLLNVKKAVLKKSDPKTEGKGLAAASSGLLVCGLVMCILVNVGVPSVYNLIDKKIYLPGETTQSNTDKEQEENNSVQESTSAADGTGDVSSDNTAATDVKQVAQQLMNDMIANAGGDRSKFDSLFRNTDESEIDKYYNTSFEQFKNYDKSLVAIAAQNDRYVWFTVLYYSIPADYPAQNESSVYLSTIMGNENGEWKIENTAEAKSQLQSEYEKASFTQDGYSAYQNGNAWAKFFIPFQLEGNDTLYYENTVMCKVTEMYMDDEGNANVTFYCSNGTGREVTVKELKDLTVTDSETTLFSIGTEFNHTLAPGEVFIHTVTVTADSIDFSTWNSPRIANFEFTFE